MTVIGIAVFLSHSLRVETLCRKTATIIPFTLKFAHHFYEHLFSRDGKSKAVMMIKGDNIKCLAHRKCTVSVS